MDDTIARAVVGGLIFNGVGFLALAWVLRKGVSIQSIQLVRHIDCCDCNCDCHDDEEIGLDDLDDDDENLLGDPDAWKRKRGPG